MEKVAYNIARTEFLYKVDKGGHPYLGHLLRVVEGAKRNPDKCGVNEMELEVVALLHDLLEDCPNWTEDHISAIFDNNNITLALRRLTRVKSQSYKIYIEGISKNEIARIVKIADLEDNMNIARLSQIEDDDIKRLQKYLRSYKFLTGQTEKY